MKKIMFFIVILLYYGGSMKDKRHILSIVVVMVLVSFMSLSFAVSYSYITQAKINKNTVKAVTANMTYTLK